MEHTQEAVIDLGSYHYDPDRAPEYVPPWPGWAWLRRWLPVALALLLVAPLAGAAGGPPPALEPLWTLPTADLGQAARVAADERHLYVPSETGEGRTLTAHRVEDGRVEWRAPIEGGTDAFVRMVGSVPVVTTYGRARPSGLTTAYHPDTGQRLWSHPGSVFEELGAWLLLEQGPVEDELKITAADAATGEPAGTLRVTEPERERAAWESPSGTIEVFTLRRDGLLTRYDLVTGAVLATAETPHVEQLRAATQNRLMIVNGLLTVLDNTADPPVTATFDPVTLAPGASFPGDDIVVPCGPVVCVAYHSREPWEVHGMDPVTGRSRWSVSCGDCGSLYPTRLPEDRLWLDGSAIEAGTEQRVPRSWVVDAETGERLTDRVEWGLASWPGDPGLLLNRIEDQQVIDPDQPPRIWWAWWDADLTGRTVLGSVEAHSCAPHLPYLVCVIEEGETTVWRVRP